jgi:D-glycerate 3-kinase
MDDFYRPYEELVRLHEETGDDVYAMRGLAPTYDIQLLSEVLRALRGRELPVRVPRYDKGARGGRGDRLEEWEVVTHVPDIIVVEGWCLGYHPNTPLDRVNDAFCQLCDLVHVYCDAWIYLEVEDYGVVYEWREEQEQGLRQCGRGMSPNDVRAFVDRFMPTYHGWSVKGGCWGTKPTLTMSLDKLRQPT